MADKVSAPARLRTLLRQRKLIQGFPLLFQSGFGVAASRIAGPDAGLLGAEEMLNTGRGVIEALMGSGVVAIADGDDGYGGGGSLTVRRTVTSFGNIGFGGVLIEDQLAPKACGHIDGRKVLGRQEAVNRIRAAVDGAKRGNEIVVVGRTDARQAVSLSEALFRMEAFAAEGAEMLFIDALEDADEMRSFCNCNPLIRDTPKMANMLEGGKSPLLSPSELEDLGFAVVAYPLTLLGSAVQAMEDALDVIHSGRQVSPGRMKNLQGLKEVVKFDEYDMAAALYSVPESTVGKEGEGSDKSWQKERAQVREDSVREIITPEVVGVETCQRLDESSESRSAKDDDKSSPDSEAAEGSNFLQRIGEAMGPEILLTVSDVQTGEVEFEIKLPAGWIKMSSAVIPKIAGIDLEGIVSEILQREETLLEEGKIGAVLLDRVIDQDRIRIVIVST